MNPLNGDINLQNIIKELVSINNIEVIIETGTHRGWSTGFFAKIAKQVITTEINPEWLAIAKENLKDNSNIEFVLGDSATVLKDILAKFGNKKVLLFLDSHFNNDLSLDRELALIKESDILPYILIHDFKVPNRQDLGYDTWDGHEYSIESFINVIENIYHKNGIKGYQYKYNQESDIGQRGCIIVEPII